MEGWRGWSVGAGEWPQRWVPTRPAYILGSKKLRNKSGGSPLGLGSDLRKGHSLDVHCEQTGPGVHRAGRAVQIDHLRVINLLKHHSFFYIPGLSSISIKDIVFFLLGCWKHFRIIIQNFSKSSHFLSWGLIL